MKNVVILISLISVMLALSVRADDELSLDKDQIVYGKTVGPTFQLYYDFASGESETDAATVYVPVEQTSTNNSDYSILQLEGVTSLFDSSNDTQVMTYPVVVKVGGTPKYVYAAVKLASGTTYKVIAKSASAYSNKDEVIGIEISLFDICKQSNGDCSNLAIGSTNQTGPIKALLYFFLSADSMAEDGATLIEPSNYSGGVYYNAQLSNRIYTQSQLKTSVDNIRTGDGRLSVKYSTNVLMGTTFFKKVIAFKQPSAVAIWRDVVASIPTVLFSNDLGTSQSSEVDITNLQNDTDYNISVAFLDKYKFATELSPSVAGRPLKIQELLEKNSCFLLTAGFGQDHFIIDYFRNFRDQILSNYVLGRAFVKTYYELAPEYALMLYKHDSIRWVVRGLAYFLYYLFNYYLIIGLVFSLALGYFYLKTRKKKAELLS